MLELLSSPPRIFYALHFDPSVDKQKKLRYIQILFHHSKENNPFLFNFNVNDKKIDYFIIN